MKKNIIIITIFTIFTLLSAGTLFVGLEGSAPQTFSTDLSGFPDVNWVSNFSFDVSGAAATPAGIIYLCNGAFTTHLYEATMTSTPQQICTISEDMSSLAYGRDTLWGFSNYASPKGIYSIDTNTGEATLALDVYTNTGYRFFALDYNPVDDLFYGYTEYGNSGLYSINIDTGEMIFLTGSIPASNGQGRGMAVGNNTAYLTATRGDDGIPYYSYDLSQGVGGSWVEFTNPYPNHHSTGGSTWIPDPLSTIEIQGNLIGSDQPEYGLENCELTLAGAETYQVFSDENGDFMFPAVEQNDDYLLTVSKEGYELFTQEITVDTENIDLETIMLNEITLPATNVFATINEDDTIAYITWEAPELDRQLEGYEIFRFLEVNGEVPEMWESISSINDTDYSDETWTDLEADIYQYAIVALYSNDLVAEAAFSNSVEKVGLENEIDVVNPIIHLNNYPNPFNSSSAGRCPTTTISFELSENSEQIKLEIFNIKGKIIKTFDVTINSNKGSVIWNGQDESNNNVSSGLYIYKLSSQHHTLQRKMLMIK